MPFRFVEEEETEEVPQEEQKFRFIESAKPPGSQLTRQAAQYSARGLETILGLPRATGEFLERLVPKKTLIKGAEKIGLGEGAKTLIGLTEKYAPYKLFPKQEDVREAGKAIFGEMFEPQSPTEEKIGETVYDFVSLAFPFPGAIKPSRAFFLASGANAAKELGDWLGYSPSTQELMKLGFYGISAFVHPNATKNFYQKNYKEAEKLLPPNATVSSTRLESALNEIENDLRKGGISSADKPALTQIENIRKEMQGAQIPVDSLVSAKRKLGIERGNIYKQLEGNKPGIKIAHRNIERVSNALDSALNEYGQFHPEWAKHFKEANNAFAAAERSKKAAARIGKLLPKVGVAHVGLSHLLGHLGGGLKGAAAAAAIGVPTYLVGRTLNRIMRSPPLRKEFYRLYEAALKGETGVMEKSLKTLDKGLGAMEKARPLEEEEEVEFDFNSLPAKP